MDINPKPCHSVGGSLWNPGYAAMGPPIAIRQNKTENVSPTFSFKIWSHNWVGTTTATAKDTYNRTSTDSVAVNLPATNQFVYDLNGNLRTNNTRIFDYDDENQLIRVTEPNAWKTEFVYDGLRRMRIDKEFIWNVSLA